MNADEISKGPILRLQQSHHSQIPEHYLTVARGIIAMLTQKLHKRKLCRTSSSANGLSYTHTPESSALQGRLLTETTSCVTHRMLEVQFHGAGSGRFIYLATRAQQRTLRCRAAAGHEVEEPTTRSGRLHRATYLSNPTVIWTIVIIIWNQGPALR